MCWTAMFLLTFRCNSRMNCNVAVTLLSMGECSLSFKLLVRCLIHQAWNLLVVVDFECFYSQSQGTAVGAGALRSPSSRSSSSEMVDDLIHQLDVGDLQVVSSLVFFKQWDPSPHYSRLANISVQPTDHFHIQYHMYLEIPCMNGSIKVSKPSVTIMICGDNGSEFWKESEDSKEQTYWLANCSCTLPMHPMFSAWVWLNYVLAFLCCLTFSVTTGIKSLPLTLLSFYFAAAALSGLWSSFLLIIIGGGLGGRCQSNRGLHPTIARHRWWRCATRNTSPAVSSSRLWRQSCPQLLLLLLRCWAAGLLLILGLPMFRHFEKSILCVSIDAKQNIIYVFRGYSIVYYCVL